MERFLCCEGCSQHNPQSSGVVPSTPGMLVADHTEDCGGLSESTNDRQRLSHDTYCCERRSPLIRSRNRHSRSTGVRMRRTRGQSTRRYANSSGSRYTRGCKGNSSRHNRGSRVNITHQVTTLGAVVTVTRCHSRAHTLPLSRCFSPTTEYPVGGYFGVHVANSVGSGAAVLSRPVPARL